MADGKKAGRVYLIGAGPGDPGLITLNGLEALKQATAVVYDYLASPELLQHARPDAKVIYVGKKGGGPEGPVHAMEQDEINALLVELASAGHVVARLKGGDPCVFGRGGEEALSLAERGIEFEVVPGVTAAIAGAAYAGIPITHRGISASLAILTGHEDPSKAEGGPGTHVDWQKVATGVGTLAVYMGMKNLPQLVGSIIAGGRRSSTPVAVISWGTCPSQRVVTGTLENIVERVREADIQPPAITIIGEVVGLRDKLSWFEKLPLFGLRIVVTRAREQAGTLAGKLRRLGAEAIEFPTIRIAPLSDDKLRRLDEAIGSLGRYQWIIFTSVNGVDAFFERMLKLGKDARSVAGSKLCAIGPATAQALRARSLVADLLPEAFVAESVLAAFDTLGPMEGVRVLLPRAEAGRDTLPAGLRKLGAEVDDVPVYETVLAGDHPADLRRRIENAEFDVVTFTSSSTVRNFTEIIGIDHAREVCRKTATASIGPVTSKTARDLGIPIGIEAEEYTIEGLIEAVKKMKKKAEGGRLKAEGKKKPERT